MADLKRFLAPSAGGRWFACPGSCALIESLDIERTPPTEDSRTGDGCHLLLQRSIDEHRSPVSFVGEMLELDGRDYRDLPPAQRAFLVEAVHAASVDHAYQYVTQRRAEYGGLVVDAAVTTEERVDIGANFALESYDLDTMAMGLQAAPFEGKCSGDLDVSLLGGGYLEIIDYKNGVHHVNEVENISMLLYLIGKLKQLEPGQAQMARLTIVQPNSLRTDLPVVRTWEVPLQADKLIEIVNRVTLAAERTLDPNAPRVPGEHCRATYCPAQAVCPELGGVAVTALQGTVDLGTVAELMQGPGTVIELTEPTPNDPLLINAVHNVNPLADEGYTVAEQMAGTPDLIDALKLTPDQMTPEQLANILDAEEMIRSWLKAVRKHASAQHLAGHRLPRHKMVLGNRSCDWVGEDEEVRKKLGNTNRIGSDGKASGRLRLADYTVTKTVSPNQAKQRIKPMVTARTWKRIEDDMMAWSPGAPTLVHESDGREEYAVPNVAEAFGVDSGPSADADSEALPDFLT